MNERMALIRETTKTLPASRQMKAINEAMEQEIENTANEIKSENTFFDDTARLLVSIPSCA